MNRQDGPEYTAVQPLSEREQEVLHYFSEGLSNREIAEKMIVALSTVKWYARQIYNKLGVDNRAEAVERARTAGLLLDTTEESALSNELPGQLSSFVGRENEIAAITRLLKEARLVTLTGAGGSGKTRLALRVAAIMAGDYADGVIFVSLASTPDPALVLNTIAHEVGLDEQSQKSTAAILHHFFQRKQSLLVLDNFEHLLPTAPLVSDLLTAAPQLTVLATSREALNLTGEFEFLVPPLGLPDQALSITAADLSQVESAILFDQRARMANHNYRLTDENAPAVAQICQRLDGLPLAIELAAARIKFYTPQQLLNRLDERLQILTGGPRDLPSRQRTLRNTIEWSYNLLDEQEQQLFARLGVFTDGRSIEAVESICIPGLAIDVLDGLESLLNKSLIYQEDGPGGQPRFFMLETIHEYALERVTASGELEAVRNQHLNFFRSLAERIEQGYRRQDQLLLIEQTDAEFGNLRTAFEWAMSSGQFEAAAGLVSSLDYYFIYKEGLVEGYRWSKRVYNNIEAISPTYHIRFLLAAARLVLYTGNIKQSLALIRQGLSLAYKEGDMKNRAWLLILLGMAGSAQAAGPEEYGEVIGHFEESIALFEEFGDKPGIAQALNALGEVARGIGDYERAKAVYEQALAICYETGEIYRQSMLQANLAFVAYRLGDYKGARDLTIRLLRQRYENEMSYWIVVGLALLAGSVGKLGDTEKAAQLLGASVAMLESMGMPYQMYDQPEIDLYIADTRAQLGEVTFNKAWNEGQKMTVDQALAYVFSLEE